MNNNRIILALLLISITTCIQIFGYAQDINETTTNVPTINYIFESIVVPGIDFLEVTATNDHGHYAGNTMTPDGTKPIAFTIINGEFTTYDVPDSLKTVVYALNNAGQAVGFYTDQDQIDHGILIHNGEITIVDFPDATHTQPFGISEDGQVIGDVVDEAGNIYGYIGDEQFEVPSAMTTFADDINAAGVLVGSYVDGDGKYHGFTRQPDGSFTDINLPGDPNLEYIFVNAINDAGIILFRAQAVDDIARVYVLYPNSVPLEFQFPGGLETVARDIDVNNQIVGYYDLPDGRRQSFIARPSSQTDAEHYQNTFYTNLNKGLNLVSLPLRTPYPMTAKSLVGLTGATVVIALDAANQRFIGWTPSSPNDGFAIEGGQAYIVNVPKQRHVLYTGAYWENQTDIGAAPIPTRNIPQHQHWAFVVSGLLKPSQNYDGYQVTVRNLRTNARMTTRVQDNYFVAATADLNYRRVVQVGDTLELTVTDIDGNVASERLKFTVTPDSLANAHLTVHLDRIGTPKQNLLLQNYPNPFNPETWIPYHLVEASSVSISIYSTTGDIIRTLSLGYKSAGFYHNPGRAAYWDGKNTSGESVASGIYFYQLTTESFQQTRRMIILK